MTYKVDPDFWLCGSPPEVANRAIARALRRSVPNAHAWKWYLSMLALGFERGEFKIASKHKDEGEG